MAASPLVKRFEALSLRERALVAGTILALVVAMWDTMLMEPLRRTRIALDAELNEASSFGVSAQSDNVDDPRQIALTRVGELQTQIGGLDARLTSTASGFVSSGKMIAVLHDMLAAQGELELVSIRNLPVTSLVPPAEGGAPQAPYVHAIELVIDGEYADILAYLAELEALPWKFRWSSLDLTTAGYPRNRVRLQLSTLSLDATWLGV
jgi:MSHA biogenesis protein MshJ